MSLIDPMNPQQRTQLKILTWLGIVAFCGLYLGDLFGPTKTGEASILAGIDPSMVKELRLHTSSHHVTLSRTGTDWYQHPPTIDTVSQAHINQTVADLFAMKARPVDGLRAAEANIGMVRLELDVTGEPPLVLLFGRASPVGDGHYVSMGSAVHVTSTPLPPSLVDSNSALASSRMLTPGRGTNRTEDQGLDDTSTGVRPMGDFEPHR